MLFWFVFGGLAGWLASKVTGNDETMGCIGNVVVGCIGSFIGGIIGTKVLHVGKVTGFNLPSFFLAVAGSVILLFVLNGFKAKK